MNNARVTKRGDGEAFEALDSESRDANLLKRYRTDPAIAENDPGTAQLAHRMRLQRAAARLSRGFVDIDQGCCILEKASVTTCPDYAAKAKANESASVISPRINGAQATGTWHQKREVSR